MDRRAILTTLAAALAACTSTEKAPIIPATAGEWKQSAVRNPPDPAPLLGRYAPLKTWEAAFDGPVPLTATYYRMASDTVAFELMQKHRAEPGVTHFYHGPLFVEIRAAGVEAAKLNAVAKDLEDALKR